MAVAGSLTYDTKIDKSGFEKDLKSISKAVKVAIGAITTTIAGISTYAIKVGSDFEEGMSKVQAISGATAEEIGKLTEKAKEMGAKTKFSATESADAFQYMAMAGWKTEDMLNGIEGIMNLAAASGEDLASVSDIVTDALTAFGLQAKDSGHFADVLAKASSNSNTNVGLMGETFKYVAPLAGSMKYSVEDTAVAIGLMANAGIKGSQAGTALRSMLTRLVKPPKDAAYALNKLNISAKNSDGTMKPLAQTMKELRTKFANLSESQKASYAASIAGQEAMSGMLAIVNASNDDFEKLTKAINNSDGAAKEMADTMNNNLKGSVTLLKSNLESLGIKIYEKMKEPLKKLVDTINKYISKIPSMLKKVYDWITKNRDVIKNLIKVVASLTAGMLAYKATLVAIQAIQTAKNILKTVSAFLSLIPTIKSAKDAMLLLNMAFSANPIGLLVGGVVALTTALVAFSLKQSDSQREARKFAEEMANSRKAVEEYNEGIDRTTNANLSHIEATSKLKDELKTLVDENGKVKKGYEGRVDFILKELNQALGTEYEQTDGIIKKYKQLQYEIDNLVEKKKAEIILQGEEQKYREAIENRAEAVEQLKKAQEELGMTYVEAKNKISEYYDKINNIRMDDYSSYAEYQLECNKLLSQEPEIKALEVKMKAYEDAEGKVRDYNNNIKKYEENAVKFAEKRYNEIANIITVTTESWTSKTSEEIDKSIQEQSNSIKQYKEIYKNTGDEIAKQNAEQAQKNLESLVNQLIERGPTIEKLGEEEKLAWKTLGEESYEYYSMSMPLDEDLKTKIQEATGIIAAGTPQMQEKAEELGRKTVEAFDKSADAKQKGLNTITEYLNGVSDNEKREFLKLAGIENVDKVLDELNRGDLSEENGKNILKGLWNGLKNGTWQGKILGVASGLAKSVNKSFTGKDGWDEHSPSKKMKKFAENYIQPISDVMNNRKKKITNTAKELAMSVNKTMMKEMNDNIVRKMQNAVALETGAINARASIKANNSMLNVVQATFNVDGSVNIDGQKAGRIITPYMTKTLRVGGVY